MNTRPRNTPHDVPYVPGPGISAPLIPAEVVSAQIITAVHENAVLGVLNTLWANDQSLDTRTVEGTVPPYRQIIAGSGMNGGGNLSADVTLNANVTSVFGQIGDVVLTPADLEQAGAVPASRRVIAGAGLYGGGDLSADVTLQANIVSVFGRTGPILAVSGDYSASQITDAVSVRNQYIDPVWIESLSWAKISGAPPFITSLTPWTSDIDGGTHNLSNVAKIGMNGILPGNGNVNINQTGLAYGISISQPDTTRRAMIQMVNDTSNGVTIEVHGSAYTTTPQTARLSSNVIPLDIVCGGTGVAGLHLLPTGQIGVNNSAPAHALDVTGDVNVSGQFLINGTPIEVSQTPWLQSIDGGNFQLSNVGKILMGNPTGPNNGAITVSQVAGQNYGLTVLQPAANARAMISVVNDGGGSVTIEAHGSAYSTTPGTARINSGTMPLVINCNNVAPSSTIYLMPTGFIGINQPAPAFALDVLGDVNVTGHFKINGAVIAGQSPWLQDIDAGNFQLSNVGKILMGSPVGSNNGAITVSQVAGQNYGITVLQPATTGRAMIQLLNDSNFGLNIGAQSSAYSTAPNTARINSNSMPIDLVCGGITSLRLLNTTGFIGVNNQFAPAYPLDVIGDINVTGQFLINGVAAAGMTTGSVRTYDDDAAAATAGLPVGFIYSDPTGVVRCRMM